MQAIVMMTGEHFTNFFLDGLPQIAIGLDDEHLGPPEVWLQVPKKMVPSDAGLAAHITAKLIEQGQQPALSYGMKIDHGFMTVYYWLDNEHGTADGADRAELHDAAVDDDPAVLRVRQ